MRAWHFVIGLNPFKGRTIHVEMLTPFAIPRDRGSSHPGLNHRYKRLPLPCHGCVNTVCCLWQVDRIA